MTKLIIYGISIFLFFKIGKTYPCYYSRGKPVEVRWTKPTGIIAFLWLLLVCAPFTTIVILIIIRFHSKTREAKDKQRTRTKESNTDRLLISTAPPIAIETV
jgi:hypothetical protein